MADDFDGMMSGLGGVAVWGGGERTEKNGSNGWGAVTLTRGLQWPINEPCSRLMSNFNIKARKWLALVGNG